MMSNYMQLVKKYALLSTFFTLSSTHLPAEPFAIVGGDCNNSTTPYVALVSSTGNASEVFLPDPVGPTSIQSVAMNPSGQSIVGGGDYSLVGHFYTAFVSPNGTASKLALPSVPGVIKTVSINSLGRAIVGGFDGNGIPYAALVAPSGSVTPISLPLLPGFNHVDAVSNNDAGQAILGGKIDGQAYAALVTPAGSATHLFLPGVTDGTIGTVAMNFSGHAIIGGADDNSASYYAAVVTPSGSVSQIFLPNFSGVGSLWDVAINDAGQAIV